MEDNRYWHELVEQENKFIDRLEEKPCKQELIEILKSLYDKLENKPHSQDLIKGLVNYYKRTDNNFFSLELIENLINTYEEWEKNPYKQELIERISDFYNKVDYSPYLQELAEELVKIYENWDEGLYKQRLIDRVRSLCDKHDDKPHWHDLIERTKNFRGDHESFINNAKNYETFYANLYGLFMQIEIDIDKMRSLSQEQILITIFKRVYNFIIASKDDYRLFDESSRLYANVFDACFFTSLCMFIHDSKRIKGMSLRRFIYENSPFQYSVKGSKNYFDYNYTTKESIGNESILYEETKLRQVRYRLLSERTVYNKKPEWSGITADSEHEWAFYYALCNLSEMAQKTYKGIGNLNNDIAKVFNMPKDESYPQETNEAFKKFSSKLKKIKYENYLELQREILTHICKDKIYFGMNIYRFEKQLKLYNILYEVRCLLECEDDEKENQIIKKSIVLNDIHFHKLYQDFSLSGDLSCTASHATRFYAFRNAVVGSSRLIYDALIDNGYLGDWRKLFLNTINKMTAKVFYDPAEIDYTVAPGAQEKFEKIISVSVKQQLIMYHTQKSTDRNKSL